MNTDTFPTLRVECCYCHVEMRAGAEPTSHGACPECASAQMELIRSASRARKTASHLAGSVSALPGVDPWLLIAKEAK